MPVILGGGLSGLSAAYYLLKSNKLLTKPISIIETSNRIGGWIKSENQNDFVLESGPRTIRPIGPAGSNTLKLLEDLKLEQKIKPIFATDSAAKNRMIYANNELCLLPSDLGSARKILPPFSKSLVSSILNDLKVGKSKEKLNDESIYSFTERRFGQEVADYLISPMICGICAGDAKEISVKFLMKDIFENEQKYGGVIKGFILNKLFGKSSKAGYVNSELAKKAEREKWKIYSLDGGLEVLPQTLGENLTKNNVDIKLGSECDEITFDGNKVNLGIDNGEDITTDYLISSISSLRLSYLLKPQHPDLAKELKAIPFVDVGVVNLQYNTPNLLQNDGFGFLVPPSENLPILGVIYDSCCFKTSGNTILTVMMGGKWFKKYFGPDPTEQELLEIAKRHVKKILKIKQLPNISRVHILNKCIPQYVVGHHQRIEKIRYYIKEKKLPLGLCGSSYDGVGVNDVILSAKNLVKTIND